MVDAVVSFVVEKLGDALIGETFILLGVRNKVEGLRDELIRMQCFLKDADAKEQLGDERVRNWVKEVRNLAYDSEDVIDTFTGKVDSTRKTNGIKNLIIRKTLMLKNMIHLHRVGNEILAIQDRLKAISDSRITYGIKDLGDNEAWRSEANQKTIQHPLRNRYPHVEDNDVIGFEEHTKTLLTELMKDDERRCVISVVGVGGLGKTTLAKKMYWHDMVKSCFDFCGWSSISQQLNVKDVLGELMKCMSLADSELLMNEGGLMAKLYNYLKDKRYFVVLDDIWKVDHWNTLSHAFPAGKRGSKILLTTRNKEVALHADSSSLHYEPQLLNEDDSWTLLFKKAFPRNTMNANCNASRLEMLGREMVRKCGGLPLGICVLGGLLATKRAEIKQWELVHRDVASYINSGKDGGVNGILALSFHDLPSHLKQCFLYLGIFLDTTIQRNKLIQLWIAEGFIAHTHENLQVTLEDIGKHQYLAELIQRCMVQSGKESFSPTKWRKHQICRMHDLMRDFCLSKGKEIGFLDQISNAISSDALSNITCRRSRRCAVNLVTYREDTKRYDIYFKNSCYALRALLVIFPWESTPAHLNYQSFKLLRVLDLENKIEFDNIKMTKEVSKLIHLRYLVINYVSEISSSIGNLQNLEFLKLGTKGLLPETATKLVQLRHLILFRSLVAQKFKIESLVKLQTIAIGAGKWIRKGCLEKLPNLRKMDVWDTSRPQTNIILEEIAGINGSSSSSPSDGQYHNPIRSLCIDTREGFPNSIFESLSCCHNLHTLDLTGKVDIVNLHRYPPSLTKLSLNDASFTEDPMATLQSLPKLRVLNLDSCHYRGSKMACSSKGFPQLQYLFLFELENVVEWTVDQGGMPNLKELHIHNCPRLSMFPEEFGFITTLEKLNGEKWDSRSMKKTIYKLRNQLPLPRPIPDSPPLPPQRFGLPPPPLPPNISPHLRLDLPPPPPPLPNFSPHLRLSAARRLDGINKGSSKSTNRI